MSQSPTLFERALAFATEAHAGTTRKFANTPYILHPMETAVIASTMTTDQHVLCAALLHDVVEDTPHTIEEIRTLFGNRVATLVLSETESKSEQSLAGATWRARKELSLSKLRNARDTAVKIMWLSDKLSNMRSFYRLFLLEGPAMWERLNQKDPAQQAWYYYQIKDATKEFSNCLAWLEYSHLIQLIFKGVPHD